MIHATHAMHITHIWCICAHDNSCRVLFWSTPYLCHHSNIYTTLWITMWVSCVYSVCKL